MSILAATILLILIIDPLGNIPLFLVALREVPRERHRRVIVREMLVALGFMIVFLFAGQYILRYLQVSDDSLTIAGGIILFLISLRMVFPPPGGVFGPHPGGEPFIVPLAVPLMAGPSSLVTIMLLGSREPDRWPQWLAAILAAWSVSATILILAAPIGRVVGEKGITAMERLMGLLLTAVAVQMLLTGIRQFWFHLTTQPA